MKYLVIELNETPHIIMDRDDTGTEPLIFNDKYSAFRVSNQCKKGLVYPIEDVMKIFERIKVISRIYSAENIIDELNALINEIV